MQTLTLDSGSGRLLIDSHIIAPIPLDEFVVVMHTAGVMYDHCTPNQGWENFGLPVIFRGKNFGLVLTFQGDTLKSFFLSWHDGLSGQKGYDASELQLRADQRSLTRFLQKTLGRPPDQSSDHTSTYYFKWGSITANYSIRSLTTGISMSWKNSDE
jgi:hypothetical protein